MEEHKTDNVVIKSGDAYTYDEAVELTGHGRYNYLLLAVCCIIANAFALDMFGFATVVAASSCDLKMGLKEIGILASAPFAEMPAPRRVSERQWDILLEYMESDVNFAKGAMANDGPLGKLQTLQKWQALSASLNSEGTGCTKSPKQWREGDNAPPWPPHFTPPAVVPVATPAQLEVFESDSPSLLLPLPPLPPPLPFFTVPPSPEHCWLVPSPSELTMPPTPSPPQPYRSTLPPSPPPPSPPPLPSPPPRDSAAVVMATPPARARRGRGGTIRGSESASRRPCVLFAFPWGYYADTHGRRRALLLSTAVGFLFAAISSFAPSWQFMLVVKLIGSSFSTASFTLSMTILGECTVVQHRSQFLQIMNSFNMASEVVAFSLAYLILPLTFNLPLPWFGMTFRSWRLFTFILALPLGIGGLFMFWLEESPKYLASRGHHIKALEVLERIYKINGGKKDGYPVKHILTSDEEVKQTSSFWTSISEHTAPIFKPPLLWRTIQLYFLIALCCSTNNVFMMWFPTMVNFFFNSFNEEQKTAQSFCDRIYSQTKASPEIEAYTCNDTISTSTIYSGMACGLFFFLINLAISKFASRPRLVLITTLIVSGVSSTLVNLKEPVANMVFFTLVQSTALGIGCVVAYFVDLYPTCHRGLVTSLGMMVARLVSFMGVNVIGMVINSHCQLTFYCLSLLGFSGVIVSLCLPPDRKSVSK